MMSSFSLTSSPTRTMTAPQPQSVLSGSWRCSSRRGCSGSCWRRGFLGGALGLSGVSDRLALRAGASHPQPTSACDRGPFWQEAAIESHGIDSSPPRSPASQSDPSGQSAVSIRPSWYAQMR